MCLVRIERRRKYNPKNNGHNVPLQRPRAVHALRWDQYEKYLGGKLWGLLSFVALLSIFCPCGTFPSEFFPQYDGTF